jgi:hypothetical protein
MPEPQKPVHNELIVDEASGELSEEQLDQVAGGIIIHGRFSPPPDPDRVAQTTLEDPLLGGPDTTLTSPV